ncbi:TRASH domain-containing protein [Acinetobacter oleivorans]|nr:TRASH domain-containing protein [Acinetobacter oleivorans]
MSVLLNNNLLVNLKNKFYYLDCINCSNKLN